MMAGAKYYISVIKQMIDQDKHTFNISRDEKVEDGYGGFITVNKEIEFEGRIYNRKSVREITDIQGTSIGLSAVSHEKLLTLSDVDIRKGDVLEFEGRTLRVKFANDYFNICKQIELEVIEDG